jgi:hypothetical protein
MRAQNSWSRHRHSRRRTARNTSSRRCRRPGQAARLPLAPAPTLLEAIRVARADRRPPTRGLRSASVCRPRARATPRRVRWCGPLTATQRGERPAKFLHFGKKLIESVLNLRADFVDHRCSMDQVTGASRGSYDNQPTDRPICSLRHATSTCRPETAQPRLWPDPDARESPIRSPRSWRRRRSHTWQSDDARRAALTTALS